MTKFEDNISPYLSFVEGAAPSSPAATNFKLYYDSSDHLLKWKNSAGTVTSLATNPMTTAGDIIYGGASGTPTRLAGGTSSYVLTSNGATSAPSWQAAAGGGSGAALGRTRYSAGSDAATYTTTSGTQADVDATNAIVTFTAPTSTNVIVDVAAVLGQNSTSNCFVGIRESTTNLIAAQLVFGNMNGPVVCIQRSFLITGISAGSHTYKLAWSTAGGTLSMYSGPTYGKVELTVWDAG